MFETRLIDDPVLRETVVNDVLAHPNTPLEDLRHWANAGLRGDDAADAARMMRGGGMTVLATVECLPDYLALAQDRRAEVLERFAVLREQLPQWQSTDIFRYATYALTRTVIEAPITVQQRSAVLDALRGRAGGPLIRRMNQEVIVRQAVVDDLTARPGTPAEDLNAWADARITDAAAAAAALVLRRGGMSVPTALAFLPDYLGQSEAERAQALERFGMLRLRGQNWSEAQILELARRPLAPSVFARLSEHQVEHAAAEVIAVLSDAAWAYALTALDDLSDRAWLQWIGGRSDAELTRLRTAEGPEAAALHIEHARSWARATARYELRDAVNYVRRSWTREAAPQFELNDAMMLDLQARAPSLRWLQKVTCAVYNSRGTLLEAPNTTRQFSTSRELEMLEMLSPLRLDAQNLNTALVAAELLPELSAPGDVPARGVYARFCRSLGRSEPDVRSDIADTLSIFKALLATAPLDQRINLLTAFTADYRTTRDSMEHRVRDSLQHGEAVLQAMAWCRQTPATQDAPVVDSENAWERDRQLTARATALAQARPTDPTDPSMVAAATARGAPALAACLARLGGLPAEVTYFYEMAGADADRQQLAQTYANVSLALAGAVRAWDGRGPLPHHLREYVKREFVTQPEAGQPANVLRFANLASLDRFMQVCEAARLPANADRAFRVAALDLLDAFPAPAAPVQRQTVCIACGEEDDEPRVELHGCSCSATMCNGCSKGSLAALPQKTTCHSRSECGAPLTGEYLERLGISEADALHLRARHHSNKLATVPNPFELDQTRDQSLHGRIRVRPVFGPQDIPDLPHDADLVIIRMLMQGLGFSNNAQGERVERECYHCGKAASKDENCLHMARQRPDHDHADWDFVAGPYDPVHGFGVYAEDGLPAQQYIPLAVGPLGAAGFYDSLPRGVMTPQTRAYVNARRAAWLAEIDRREGRAGAVIQPVHRRIGPPRYQNLPPEPLRRVQVPVRNANIRPWNRAGAGDTWGNAGWNGGRERW